ncbi:MAG: winged helix-turn-helix domain-containing protein, partial [Schaalia sp.]|nr:winged helix-turn-helix domain-containing protein [Schaalia sp.]
MPTTNVGTLSEPQFNILTALAAANSPLTQRALSVATSMSLGRVNTAIRECEAAGY